MNDTPLDHEEAEEAKRVESNREWGHALGRARDNDEIAKWEKENRVPSRKGFAGYRKIMRRVKL